MTVETIKAAILALPEQDQIQLEEWLADRWDAQMEKDFSPGGRGAKLIEHIETEIDAGKFRPLDR